VNFALGGVGRGEYLTKPNLTQTKPNHQWMNEWMNNYLAIGVTGLVWLGPLNNGRYFIFFFIFFPL
jgi:hypothetical protein